MSNGNSADPANTPGVAQRAMAVIWSLGGKVNISAAPTNQSGLPAVPGGNGPAISQPLVTRSQKPQPISITPQDKTSAVLLVLDEQFNPTSTAALTGGVAAYSNRFYLTTMVEARKERLQILETFGDAAIFFFDERTKIYNFAGQLLETKTDFLFGSNFYLWGSAFHELYESIARGTELVKNNRIAVLVIDNYLLYGWPINLDMQRDSMNTAKQFSFSMIIREHKLITSKLEDLYTIQQFVPPCSEESPGLLQDLSISITFQLTTLNTLNEEIATITTAERRANSTNYDEKVKAREKSLATLRGYQQEFASRINQSGATADKYDTTGIGAQRHIEQKWPT